MSTNSFKQYLLLENEQFLAFQMNDVLQDLQNLQSEIQSIGTRNLVTTSQLIGNNIRNIVHSHWDISSDKPLLTLQKCGVAIFKAIQKKSDLKEILPDIISDMNTAVADLKSPVNKFASPSSKTIPDDEAPSELSASGDLSPENLPLTSGPGNLNTPPAGQVN